MRFRTLLHASRSSRKNARRPRKISPTRPAYIEPLEQRLMLDIGGANQPTIVVGRTLSAYDVPDVQSNQETITLTVYNQAADPITGVLLTDTLASGVTLASASQLPDQKGQNLAWSLGTIQPYDRASVTLTVSLANPIPTQLDAGASAFGTLDAGMVNWTTAPAMLRITAIAPDLLASTPDANTTDPVIQEKAAELNYDPTQIFNFLQNNIGYNTYVGSLRGARGTLWSNAGNSLDDASLGVALMRASGIPAQYAQGTLSQSDAQQLIRSMFPPRSQAVGFVASGALTSDPTNDPQLLSETESHSWFQFDSGSGMKDADPLMPGATIGQTFAGPTTTFSEVPDSQREKTEVQLVAEITNTGSALLGLGGQQDTTVLDHTFNDVDLVGRPLSIGNLVTSTSAGSIFSATTNTYSPYLAWGDDAYDSTHDQILTGQSYQEVLTNFPFGSQVLTGLFLNVVESGPQGPSQTFNRTILDRIGYAARQGSGGGPISIPPGGAPALTNYDIYTLDVSAAAPDPHPTAERDAELQADAARLSALSDTTTDAVAAQPYARSAGMDLTRILGNNFLTLSQLHTDSLAGASEVAAYFDRPRVVMISQQLEQGSSSTPAGLNTAIDMINNAMRVVGAPGQSVAATFLFNATRGMFDNVTERDTVAALSTGGTSTPIDNTFDVFQAAAAQGIGFSEITTANLSLLDTLNIPADAKARITADVSQGFGVIVPDQNVLVSGSPNIAWAEVNIATGEYIGVDSNGGHQGAWEYLALVGESLEQQLTVIKFLSPVAGIDAGSVLGTAFILNQAVGDAREAAAELKDQKEEVEKLYEELIENGELVSMLLTEGVVATAISELKKNTLPDIEKLVRNTLGVADNAFSAALDATVKRMTGEDPKVTGILTNPLPLAVLPANQATASASVTSQPPAGAVQGTDQVTNISISHQIAANWSSAAVSSFSVTSLAASSAAVVSSSGQAVGSGTVALAAVGALPVAVAGNDQYSVNGTGNLDFYGPAETNLGVSGTWLNYSATVSGNVALTLTSADLTLNGAPLPEGTYTITAASATLAGNGNSTTPNFAGSASITATGGTVELGSVSGNLTVGGTAVNTANGPTLVGYNGTITITANGNGTDGATLNGSAANLLSVVPGPGTLTTDQNTAVSFNANVLTSFSDTYNLTAQGPAGWNVSIDGNGKVSVTPAPGTQGGTYPIRVIAQSTTNTDLVAQGTADVTVTPTQPSVTLSIIADPQLTVPFGGAELPTAFQALIKNTGPTTDTFQLTPSGVTNGFTVISSENAVTIGPGQTAIVGVYLEPTSGPLPPPATAASFTLAAMSESSSAVTESQVESFVMPAIDAVTVVGTPASLTSTPGSAATATLTLADVGNVAENVNLTAAGPADLTVGGLQPISLAAGQSTTETITLTPALTAALNDTLSATITATYGPNASPQTSTTVLSLLVRSPQTVAISQASVDANSAGNDQLGGTLAELSDTVALLQASPTDPNLLSRTQLLLNNLSPELSADPVLAPTTSQLAPIQTDAENGVVTDMLTAIPPFFTAVDELLAVEKTEQFTVSVSPNEVDLPALANQQKKLSVTVSDTGPDPVTLTLSTGTLPGGVTANLGQTQVTLQPGASQNVSLTLTSNLVSTKVFTLDVHAADSTDSALATVGHDGTAIVAVRAAAADVLGVTVNPISVTSAGARIAVSASIFNTANASRNVLAHLTIVNSSNTIVASPPDVPFTLSPTANAVNFDLGSIDTTALANGVYTLQVSLRASDGTALPGNTSEAPFLVGIPIAAGVSASPNTLPPGTSTVTTTVTVSNTDPPANPSRDSSDSTATPNAPSTSSATNNSNTSTNNGGSNSPPTSTPGGNTNTLNIAPSNIKTPPTFVAPMPPTPPSFNPPAGDAVKWIGAASGNWDVASNWLDTTTNKNHVPDATDNVTIDASGLTITVEAGNQVGQSLLLKAGSTLAIAGGNLAVSAGVEIDGTLALGSNTLTVGGGATVNGAVEWSGGTLNLEGGNLYNLGTMTLSNGLPLVSNNGGNTGNLFGQLVNEGTIVQSSGNLVVYDSIELNNTSAGLWQFTGDASIVFGSFSPTIVNSGEFQKTGGTGTSYLELPLTSTAGTFDAGSGTLTWTVDGDVFNGGTFNAGTSGTINLANGTTHNVFTGTFDGSGAGTVSLSGGNIEIGNGGATFNFAPGLFQWTNAGVNLLGNTLTNLGTLTLGSTSAPANESILANNGTQGNLGGTLVNNGSIVQQGDGALNLSDNVVFGNAAAATYDLTGDGSLVRANNTPSVVNAGIMEKTGGTGTSTIGTIFDNSGGSLAVSSGTLMLQTLGGTFTGTSFAVATGATLDLAGGSNGNVFTGTFTGTGGGTVLLENGSIVVGSGGATFDFPTGMFQWTGGGINLDGHTLGNTGSITLANANNISLFANDNFLGKNDFNLGGTLNNSGIITSSGKASLYLFDSVALNNQAGGTYVLAGDTSILNGNFSPAFTNAGELQKSEGSGTSTIGVPFSNTGGTLQVASGTLDLAGRGGTSTGATINVAAGATLDLTGNTDGNIYTGTYTGTGAGTVLLQNGAFEIGDAGATFDFPAGMFQWTGGGINLFGHTLTNAGSMTVASANNVNLYANGNFPGGPNTGSNLGGTLDNQGTIVDQGPAAIYFYDGVLLKNESVATTTLSGGASWVLGGFAPSISNAGNIQVNSASATSAIDVPLTNSGSVTVVGGELDFAQSAAVVNSGTLDAQANTLKFAGPLTNTGSIQTSGGTLAFNEPNSPSSAVNNTGTLKVDGGSATFSGPIAQDNAGFLSGGTWIAEGGGSITFPTNSNITFNRATIVLDGAASSIAGIQSLSTNDGALTVTNGAAFTTAAAFRNNGTLTLGPDSTLSVTGNYHQTAAATLDAQLGGAPASGNFGKLAISGTAALAGMLRSEFIHGYTPAAGDNFTVATYASTTGSFSAVSLAETPAVAYTAQVGVGGLVLASQAATLTATQTTLSSSSPGGANYGQLVAYTATVTTSGAGTPTGAVQFQIDGVNSGTPVSLQGGQATLTNALPAGQHAVAAFYVSDNSQFANSDDSDNPLVQSIAPAASQPSSIELYYTTYGGPPSVNKVSVALDQLTLTLGTPTPIVQNIPADGLIFLPNGDLLTANGEASEVNPNTGAVTTENQVSGDHLALDPSGKVVWTSPQPGPLYELPIDPLAPATLVTLTGDDTAVTHIAFDNAGQAYYVSSGPGGFGSFGLISLPAIGATNPTATTQRIYSNLPSAHGISFDPFSGDLFLVGSNSVTQIDPNTLKIVSELDFPNSGFTFDQGAEDGKGHLYAADNSGHLLVVDYSTTGLIGDPRNFVTTPFLQSALDDVAPLSGLGGAGIPVTVNHQLPSAGYNVNPTSITPNPASFSSTDVSWQTSFTPGVPASEQFQLSGQVTNMAPGEVRQISNGTTVTATVAAADGTQIPVSISLPPLTVAAQHIIELSPPTQTVDQGTTAAYTVELSNPLSSDETYTLAVDGLPTGESATLAASVDVPAGQTVDVPLSISVPVGTLVGTQAFVVSAQTAAGANDSVEGQLTVTSNVTLHALAVNLSISPSSAVAGQTNPAVYTLAVTNTGDTADTYNLSAALPPGFTGSFSQSTISVPPGLSNFRDVQFTLAPPSGAAAMSYPFTITATSTTDANVTATAGGDAQVLAQGVQVSLTPSSSLPGGNFDLKVTNTGSAADTFNLSLANPGALVSMLGTNQVTLNAGASQTIPVTTGPVNFATSGALPLTGVATSQTNAAVTASATANLTIPSTQSVAAQFNPATQTLSQPGAAAFLLNVNNTGNSEDSYSATIVGTTGPVTANLIGIEGQPAQSVPVFRVPGLATGAILLEVSASAFGTSTVTVLVQSLSNGSVKASATATLNVTSPTSGTPTLIDNTGLSLAEGASATITSSMLQAGVVGATVAPDSIVFTLTAAPTQGMLNLGGQPLAKGGTFTQADINAGRLSYTSIEEGGDSFSFGFVSGTSAPVSGTFVIGANDLALVGKGGFTVTATESQNSGNQTVATFTDPGKAEALNLYTAEINWGDGSTSPGQITIAGDSTTFTVLGQHTYAQDGTFPVQVTLTHENTPAVTVSGTALVAATSSNAVSIVGSGLAISGYEFTPLTGTNVATFTLGDGSTPIGSFSAAINWGDGTTSAGTVTESNATYTVSGSHTYGDEEHYTLQTTVTDAAAGPAGPAPVTLNGTGTIHEQLLASGGAGTPDQNFIQEIYRDLLFRQAETQGLDYWVGLLQSGESRSQVAFEIVQLAYPREFQRDTVQTLYEKYLHRAPDPGGNAYWTAFLFNGGSIEAMQQALVGSSEYWTVRGGGTIDGFLNTLYQDALGRSVDPGAKTYFEQAYANGETASQIAATIFNSDEYRRIRVDALIEEFLDRPADPGALSYYAGELAQGMSDEQIIAQLVSSDEYFAKAQI